jgi:hypothetical protein
VHGAGCGAERYRGPSVCQVAFPDRPDAALATPSGHSLRLTSQRAPHSAFLAGPQRLRALESLIRFTTGLRVYGEVLDEGRDTATQGAGSIAVRMLEGWCRGDPTDRVPLTRKPMFAVRGDADRQLGAFERCGRLERLTGTTSACRPAATFRMSRSSAISKTRSHALFGRRSSHSVRRATPSRASR